MKIGDLKPKGSDKTLKEMCLDCIHKEECKSITDGAFERNMYFEDIEPFLNIEVEIPDKYFDTVDRIKPCPNCRYQLIHDNPELLTEESNG